MKGLPTCFFPTEVVFVDDSEIYLQTLSLGLESCKTIHFKTFSNPEAALKYILGKKNIPPMYGEPEDTFSPNCYALKLNVFAFHKQIYNKQRHEQISVVIADHDLGTQSMNGVEFCQKLQDLNLQKVLFTGKSEQDFVIQAFNQGKIQQYVAKKDIKSIQDILNIIHQAQQRYFLNFTGNIMRSVIHRDPKFPLAIDSSAFKKYFDLFVQKNNIIEFYILDAVGTYLMVDEDHQIKILMVQNEDQCLANDLEYREELNSELRKQLQTRKIICYNPKFWDNDRPQIISQFVSAECIEDSEMNVKFYCACIDNPDWIHLDKAQWA